MAVTAEVASSKIILDLAEGTQTISGTNKAATDEQIMKAASAISTLCAEATEAVYYSVTSDLVEAAE